MNSLSDIRIFLGLVPKESLCTMQRRLGHGIREGRNFIVDFYHVVNFGSWHSSFKTEGFFKRKFTTIFILHQIGHREINYLEWRPAAKLFLDERLCQ
jgi:hypothetical protein